MGQRPPNRHLTKDDIHIANKHMKRCSTLYVIREMPVKRTRYLYTYVRMAKIQNTDNTKCSYGCRTTGILIHCWWECKEVQPLWKTVWWFLTKLNRVLSYSPAITLPKELKMYVHTKTCTQISLASLLIISKTWK